MRRKLRRLTRREKKLKKAILIVLVSAVVLSSAFGVVAARTGNSDALAPQTVSVSDRSYYAASVAGAGLIHEEFNGYANSEQMDMLETVRTGTAVLSEAVSEIRDVAGTNMQNLQTAFAAAQEAEDAAEASRLAEEEASRAAEEASKAAEEEASKAAEEEASKAAEEESRKAEEAERAAKETAVPATQAPTTAAPAAEADGAQNSAAGYHTVRTNSKGTVEFDENGVPVNCINVFRGAATAYYGGTCTATGTVPGYGTVAVNPRLIPYGSLLWITTPDGSFTYGPARAEDTGGFIYWNNAPVADLYFQTYDECCQFGKRNVIVYVISG